MRRATYFVKLFHAMGWRWKEGGGRGGGGGFFSRRSNQPEYRARISVFLFEDGIGMRDAHSKRSFSLSLSWWAREAAKLNAVNRDPVNRPFPCQEVRQAARLMGLMIHRGLTSWININYDVFLCKRPCKWDTSAPRRGLYILCVCVCVYIYRSSLPEKSWRGASVDLSPLIVCPPFLSESVQTQFDGV